MDNTEEHELRLKAALHYTVGKMCEEQGLAQNVQFDQQIIATISELTWRQIGLYAKDLEAFAKHAKRTTVNTEDVRLLVRRNQDLKLKIESMFSHPPEDIKIKTNKIRKKKEVQVKNDTAILDMEEDLWEVS